MDGGLECPRRSVRPNLGAVRSRVTHPRTPARDNGDRCDRCLLEEGSAEPAGEAHRGNARPVRGERADPRHDTVGRPRHDRPSGPRACARVSAVRRSTVDRAKQCGRTGSDHARVDQRRQEVTKVAPRCCRETKCLAVVRGRGDHFNIGTRLPVPILAPKEGLSSWPRRHRA